MPVGCKNTDNMTFEELGVNEPLRRAIEELGFENPMPVQEKVIPHLLNEEGDVWRPRPRRFLEIYS